MSASASLRWLAGLIVWAVHFAVVYGSESLVCTRDGGAGGHALLVGAATLGALGALAAIIAWGWRRVRLVRGAEGRDGAVFMDTLTVILGIAGVGAVLVTALPAIVIPACAPPA
jgi:hypothetical protein